MGATVHRLPPAGTRQLVTKQQLARDLGRSERWIEMRAAEGMPRAGLDRAGRRLFDLGACEKWLAARSEKVAAAAPFAPPCWVVPNTSPLASTSKSPRGTDPFEPLKPSSVVIAAILSLPVTLLAWATEIRTWLASEARQPYRNS